MRNTIRLALGFISLACTFQTTLAGEPLRNKLRGLVYEAEDWTEPKSAWQKNQVTADHWNLWTTEKQAQEKRSGGVSFQSPTIDKDRQSPEEGAPPLHTRITGIPTGLYRAYINAPGRYMAYSTDGKNWQRSPSRGEIGLGVFDIRDGTFEVWVDDRYATPNAIGPCYYDYIRFEDFTPPKLSHFSVFQTSDERLQISWISDRAIPTGTLDIKTGNDFVAAAGSDEKDLRNHRLWVDRKQLRPSSRLRIRIPLGSDYTFLSPVQQISWPTQPATPQAEQLAIPIESAAQPIGERAILAGIPLAPGTATSINGASIESEQASLPTQATVTSRWPDGSIQWLFARFLTKSESKTYTLQFNQPRKQHIIPFEIHKGDGNLIVSNGHIRLSLSTDRFALFGNVHDESNNALIGQPMLGNVRIVDDASVAWELGKPDRLELEERGPVRAVIRAEGPFHHNDHGDRFQYRIRYFLTARSPLVRVQLTLINDQVSDAYQRLTSFAIRIPLPGDGPMHTHSQRNLSITLPADETLELFQIDDRKMEIARADKKVIDKGRYSGWAVAHRNGHRVAVLVRDFWQTWPKGIAFKPDGIHVRLLPELAKNQYQSDTIWEWLQLFPWFDQGRYLFKRGLAYRSEFWVRFDHTDDPIPTGNWNTWADSLRTPPYAAPSPQYFCSTGVFGPIEAAGNGTHTDYETMVERNHKRILQNRQERREYGWMNFGDWYGERGCNWGNSEYDLSRAMALQFARTGRWDYFNLGLQMARHNATIDTVHVPWAPRFRGRVYAHSPGHVGLSIDPPAELNEPKWEQWKKRSGYFLRGAIDTGGHIFQEGNFAYYLLTGDRDFLETAESVVAAQATYLTPWFDFHIERSAGWPLVNTVAAYETTGNPFYLNAARIYVQRVLETQSPITGSWLLRQDRSECDHPPPHLGSKSFATGVLLYGLMRYDLIEPRDDVKQSIVRACRWLVEQAWNADKRGFRYKTGCDRYIDNADSGTSQAMCAPGLAYGWLIAKDPRFAEVLRICIANITGQTGDIGKQATMLIRQSAYALPVLDRVTGGEPVKPR